MQDDDESSLEPFIDSVVLLSGSIEVANGVHLGAKLLDDKIEPMNTNNLGAEVTLKIDF